MSIVGEEKDYMESPVKCHEEVRVTFAVVKGNFNVKEWNGFR